MAYNHKETEKKIYEKWEQNDAFNVEIDHDKKPYTILLPPPNASGKMHTGNVLMIAIEDLLIRWKRMQGYNALWIPGTDHAGFETQITFEKSLKKEGKSRFDYDRNTLYQMIWEFVQQNKSLIETQIKQMGASVDWSRYTFTLDPKVLETVRNTFQKMESEGLVYRDDYMVNYCPICGTTFADLEVSHVERVDPLYYMKYGPFVLATVRPETKFGDTAVAVNPKDERYKKYIGQEIEVEGLNGNFKLKVIADDYVDMEFGTGVVKMTPAHDKNDYEVGKRHGLEIKPVINLDGRLNERAGRFAGLKVQKAREVIVEELKTRGLIEKIDENYTHSVAVCYKGGHDIEPTILPNWFIKVESLKKPALEVVENDEVKIYPTWRKVTYTQWMKEMHDWPISRQIVWGIRIPAWYKISENPDLNVTFLNVAKENVTGKISELMQNGYSFTEIENGLQSLIAPKNAKYIISSEKPGDDYLQETDTFDTWFSSGQWPLVTLGYPDSEDFKYFYPTSVLETGWEIVRSWVSRMIMFGIYLTGKPPFSDVYLHGIVRALDGRKMSKSLGNVINPDEFLEQYGADALRMGLISGTANGKDFAFPKDKVIAYRNFANKLWNMTAFIQMMETKSETPIPPYSDEVYINATPRDKELIFQLGALINSVNKNLDKYRFSEAAEDIYHYMWDELAAKYIEETKTREDKDVAVSILRYVFCEGIKLLHPFMPFVTEAIWEQLGNDSLLMREIYPD